MDRNALYAVLTGDVLSPSRLVADPSGEIGDALRESFATLNEVFGRAFIPAIDIVAGGGWRMVTAQPRIALRAALYFRAELKARLGSHRVDARVGIGVGPLDRQPTLKAAGDGPADRRSRDALDSLPRTRRLALRLEDQPLSAGFDEMLGLVDHVAGRWTDKQALAITGALQNWTQERIAARWNRIGESAVSQQTVAQHLRRAGWHVLAPAVDFLEGLLA